MLLNNNNSYGLLTIILHWLIAVAIVGLFASGLYMLSIDYYHPLNQSLPHYHESIGVILALLLLARIVLRRLQVQPQPLQSGWQQRAALAMQPRALRPAASGNRLWLLYIRRRRRTHRRIQLAAYTRLAT